MPDINDPGATHYYGDGCDDDHGRSDLLGQIDHDRFHGRINLVKPDDLHHGCVEFDHSIDIRSVNVFWRGGVYKLVPSDEYARYLDLRARRGDIVAALGNDN